MNQAPGVSSAGFTILELTVVMGILSGFLLMLVQMLTSGVQIFQSGEQGQHMSDRRAVAARAVVDSLDAMIGPSRGEYQDRDLSVRMRLDWAPLGLSPEGAPSKGSVQVLRATVALDQAAAEKLDSQSGRAQMLLLPWPVGGDGVFMELRQALVLPGDELGLMNIEVLGGEDLSAGRVASMTRVLARGLLHFEIALWSQLTRNWHDQPGAGGPEYVWDSARAGSLLEGRSARDRFSLDLGPASLRDPRDDVFPRWLRITMVLDDVNAPVAEAFLDQAMTVLSDVASVDRGEVIATNGPGMVKIGSEWVGYRELRGRLLLGLRRGLRGTIPHNHPPGTRLRRGLEVVIDRPVHHGRDAHDG